MSAFTRPLAGSSHRKLVAIATIFFVSVLLIPVPAAAALIRTTDQTVRDGGDQIRAWLLSVLGTTTEGNRERKGVGTLTGGSANLSSQHSRIKIALCLGRIGGPKARVALERALRMETEKDVRNQIKFVLNEMK